MEDLARERTTKHWWCQTKLSEVFLYQDGSNGQYVLWDQKRYLKDENTVGKMAFSEVFCIIYLAFPDDAIQPWRYIKNH